MSIYNFVTKRYDREDDVNGFIPLVFPSDRASTLRGKVFCRKAADFSEFTSNSEDFKGVPVRIPTPSAAAAPPGGETSIEKKGK